jgi:hypothetical protein
MFNVTLSNKIVFSGVVYNLKNIWIIKTDLRNRFKKWCTKWFNDGVYQWSYNMLRRMRHNHSGFSKIMARGEKQVCFDYLQLFQATHYLLAMLVRFLLFVKIGHIYLNSCFWDTIFLRHNSHNHSGFSKIMARGEKQEKTSLKE